MSFTSQRQKIIDADNQASTQTLKEFEKSGIESFGTFDIEQYREIALNFLYEDLIQAHIDYDFKTALGNQYYQTSNSFAFDCLDISLYSNGIHSRRIQQWTKSALHCFDVLLINYLSNILNETVPSVTMKIKETDVYIHLISKGGNHSEIGIKFQFIYQYRSSFEHIQYTDDNGKRQVRRLSNKKYNEAKEVILNFFKEALVHLLTLYRNAKPVTAE